MGANYYDERKKAAVVRGAVKRLERLGYRVAIEPATLTPAAAGRTTFYRGGNCMIAVRLPPEVERRLEKLARKTRRSKTFYVREAILQHLEDLEDYYLAVQRLEENLPGVPLEEVERRLGLAD